MAIASTPRTGVSPEAALNRVEEEWKGEGRFPLTSDQRAFVLGVLDPLLPSRLRGSVVLEGPAGTGKTTTLLGLIQAAYLLDLEVAVAAPTHKAASVLRDKLEEARAQHSGLPEPGTLHSLLCLKPQRSVYGEPETFRQSRPPRLGHLDLLIVDECSMIGADLLKYIQEAAATFALPVLFAGDPYQLRPVNERGLSKTFEAGPKTVLTEVLRHDGAVLNLATRVRTLNYVPQIVPGSGGGSLVEVYSSLPELEEAWLKAVMEAEGKGAIRETMMVCWKNKNRRKYNEMARLKIYGEGAPKFMEGDVVVTLSAIERDNQLIHMNNEDLVISTTELLEEYFPVPALGEESAFKTWRLTTTSGTVLYVLDDTETERQRRMLKTLGNGIKLEAEKAKELKDNKTLRDVKEAWARLYFPLKEAFAEVDFRYALTVHKSQGSTYNKVFISDDYMQSRDEAKQLLYVAVTRAAKEVHHLDNRLRR
jgi:exodeoxyribonuclease-5